MGLINEGISDGLNNSELTAKLAENGLDIAGLDPTSPMFPSIAVTDKDGNTFVDFSKGMSDPAAALLAGSKLNTEFSKIEAEIGNVTGVLGDTQKSGLLSFADGIGGNEKFIESNVGQTLKKADALFAQAGSQGSRTPEQQAAFTQGTAIMANAPRLMAGWVLASDVPGGKMLYNKDLANKRQVEIELFTATDDMNMRQILDESKPAGENYGTLLQKIKAVKKDYFAQRTPQYNDSELGKAVQANT
jgi:hypothetical protein